MIRHTLVFLCVLDIVGCGSNGPKRLSVHGTVTYQGKPVAYGKIAFEPDTAKGNDGPPGVAEIQGGNYVNRPGFGPVAGPQIVRLTIYDGEAAGEMQPHGKLLATNLVLSVDLPISGGAINFDIPDGK
jgi:hypothetical protein